MKNELKISRLAIICVLCTAFSGAYGASSVRSLGGEGTYSSASSATAANSTSNTAVSRSGSVRVTPTISTSGSSTTATTGTSNSGRSTTTPRLSIGKYLGGATSVSGGSSLRPQTPSGGSSSGGEGSVDTGLVEDMINQAIDGLDAEIQDLWAEKQNVLYPSDGFVSIEDDEIYLNVDNLKGALDIATGQDGREIEIERQGDYIVWRYVGETAWNNLISVADITGPQGPQGEKGEKGEPGDVAEVDLTGYATTEEMNASIAGAVANLSSVYATVDALSGKANIEDVYTKDEVYNKTEVDDKVAEVAAGDMQEALKNYAKQDYVDQQLANKANTSDLDGLLTSDALTATLEGYATTDALTSSLNGKLDVGALTGYATQNYVDGAVKDFINTNDLTEALRNKQDKLTYTPEDSANMTQNIAENAGSETMYPSAKAVATYVANTVSEGVDINTDQISDGAITEAKLDDNLKSTLSGKQDKNIPGALGHVVITDERGNITTAQAIEASKITGLSDVATSGSYSDLSGTPDLSGYMTTSEVDTKISDATKNFLTSESETVTNITKNITNVTNLIGNEESGLTSEVALKEDLSNKIITISEENKSSETFYPSVGAVVQYTNSKISELSDTGLPVNPENLAENSIAEKHLAQGAVTSGKIADGAVTEAKLDDNLKSTLSGKQDKNIPGAAGHVVITDENGNITTAQAIDTSKITGLSNVATSGSYSDLSDTPDLGTLAKKSTITNDDIDENASIERTKLSEDVQISLSKADKAVVNDAAIGTDAVLGVDKEGNTVWYGIEM